MRDQWKDVALSFFWSVVILGVIGLFALGSTGSKPVGAVIAGLIGLVVVAISWREAFRKKFGDNTSGTSRN
jgi:hypothetical protein